MKYTKHVEHKINVRPYETVTIGASIDWDKEDDLDNSYDVDYLLHSLIKDDLVKAKNVSDNGSYIHDWVLNDA
jgi:hypothetical protein